MFGVTVFGWATFTENVCAIHNLRHHFVMEVRLKCALHITHVPHEFFKYQWKDFAYFSIKFEEGATYPMVNEQFIQATRSLRRLVHTIICFDPYEVQSTKHLACDGMDPSICISFPRAMRYPEKCVAELHNVTLKMHLY